MLMKQFAAAEVRTALDVAIAISGFQTQTRTFHINSYLPGFSKNAALSPISGLPSVQNSPSYPSMPHI